MNNPDRDWLTTGEVAKMCRVSPRTVTNWLLRGQLKGWVIPGLPDGRNRARRFLAKDVWEFLVQHGMPTDLFRLPHNLNPRRHNGVL